MSILDSLCGSLVIWIAQIQRHVMTSSPYRFRHFPRGAILACTTSFLGVLVCSGLAFLFLGISLAWAIALAGVAAFGSYYLYLNAVRKPKPTLIELISGAKVDELISSNTKPNFKLVLDIFNKYDAQDICDVFYKSSDTDKLIFYYLGQLTPQEKIELLTRPTFIREGAFLGTTLPIFHYLLREGNTRVLQALFKNLSSKQRLEVLLCTQGYSLWSPLPKIIPKIIDILFEGMTPEDRLTFLKSDLGVSDGKYLNVTHQLEDCMCLLLTPGKKYVEMTEHLLKILLKDLTKEQLKPLLARKHKLRLNQTVYYKLEVTSEKERTLLEILMLDDRAERIINLLIEHGAIEADLTCDIDTLYKNRYINLTPYRDNIKTQLKKADIFNGIDDLNEMVCGYLVGESAIKRTY